MGSHRQKSLKGSYNCGDSTNAGIDWKLQVLIFLTCAALVVSRRPDALFNPQFFAEDGTFWYAQAYTSGWLPSLFRPENGYFATLSRLIASAALLAPFHLAPLVMNLAGLSIQVLPVNILLSARCRNWAPLFSRTLMAMLYLGLPNSAELNVAAEEAQWHLALLACLLMLACPPSNPKWWLVDITILLVSGLSGPCGVILWPIALIVWLLRRSPWRLTMLATLSAAAAIQAWTLITTAEATRSHAILGATPKLAVQILAGQIYLGSTLGVASLQVQRSLTVLVVVAVFGTLLLGYCFIDMPLEWRLLLAFSSMILVASLIAPMVSLTAPQWPILKAAAGIRYWFFPMLGFVWALVWLGTLSPNRFARGIGVAGLVIACIGIVKDWKYPVYKDLHFQEYAGQFEAARPGTLVSIPIVPPGWTMPLVKRNPTCPALPFGYIDQPNEGAKVSGSLSIAGWVGATQPVRQVSILIDRELVQSIKPDRPRPDVDALYPNSPDKYKGWGAVIDMSGIAAGSHEIEVRALEADGCEADFGVVRVQR